jgi:hypothetical protein
MDLCDLGRLKLIRAVMEVKWENPLVDDMR